MLRATFLTLRANTGHILRPFYGPFWPKMAIFGHRQPQQPQMGWILGEHGWTFYSTSGGVSWDALGPEKMSMGAPELPKNGLFWPKMAIFGHRQSQQAQMGWTLVEHGWTLYFTSRGVYLSLLDHPEMSHRSPEGPENSLFWPEMAVFGHRRSQRAKMGWTLVEQGWTRLNRVEHCQTHPGRPVWAFRAPKNCHQVAPEAPKNGLFWHKKGHFWVLLPLPSGTFFGYEWF